MLGFQYANTTRLFFGREAEKALVARLADDLGHEGDVLVVYGGGSVVRSGLLPRVTAALGEAGITVHEEGGVVPNPQIGLVRTWIAKYADKKPRAILAVGGGSVSDCCKVISGAFDTLSHAMETYFGKPDENNLSDDINEAVMRSVIRNIRVLLTDPENDDARSELAWASAMAENGVLKIGKVTDFQAHQIEHQLGAYTNCNHGAGLAVIHPVLYRHIYKSGTARFTRWAQNVWGIAPKGSDEETAAAGIDALAAFIKEIGLLTTFTELGIPADTDFRAIADSTNVTAGCCKKLTRDEICEILQECL